MKNVTFISLVIIVAAAFVLKEAAFAAKDFAKDRRLVAAATNLEKLHRVTEKPHLMFDTTSTLCAPARMTRDNLHKNLDKAAYCNVYVNELAKPMMMSGHGTYPTGSLIVKSKLLDPDKPNIQLYTVMQKMADGYDPENGNWEYAIIDGTSQRVFASGKIESCIECHTDYKATDFVTRTYMKQRNRPANQPLTKPTF